MGDDRPRKRQKVVLKRNPFIDDEATVESGEPEIENEDDDEFIQDELTTGSIDIDTGLYARVDAMRAQTARQSDPNHTGSFQKCSEDERSDENSDDDDYVDCEFSPNDGVWELPCKIGQEWKAVTILLAQEQSNAASIVKSAIYREDHPGRIYVELSLVPASLQSKIEAKNVAARVSLPMLATTSAIRFIPCPDASTLLNIYQTPWRAGMWARIRGPMRLYRGDIGFIFSRRNKTINRTSMWVAVVPRINLHQTKKENPRRPAAQILNVKTLLNYQNVHIEFGETFTFQGRMFNYAGYQLFPLEDLDLFPPNPFPPVPLPEEFEQFMRLPVLSQEHWAKHRLLVQQQRTRAHDRVKILDGQYKDLLGIVLGVKEQEVEVYLTEKDDTVVVGLTNVQSSLQPGDYARIVHGEHQGWEGYITNVDGEWVDLANPQASSEIRTFITDVELYSPPVAIAVRDKMFEVGDEVSTTTAPLVTGFVTAIYDGWLELTTANSEEVQIFYREAKHTRQPKINRILDKMNKNRIDMYSMWVGRYCTVIAGPFKSHRGLIKTTHPDGRIGVQLDTCLSQITEFNFSDVLIQDNDLAISLPTPVSPFAEERDKSMMSPQEQRQIAITLPDVMIREMLNRRPGLKLPPSQTSLVAPKIRSDHPSLQLPVPRWLLGMDFVPHRIKVVHITGNGMSLEYIMPVEQSESALVRVDGQNKEIPVDQLRHLLPEKKNDLVVPLVGEYKGKVMRIKEFGQDKCTLLVVGAKAIQKKNYIHPSCDTNALACVFPPRKS